MSKTIRDDVRDVALVVAGWAIALPLLQVIGQPLNGPGTYLMLGGLLAGGALHIAGRHRQRRQAPTA